ncbi:MAG TPA: MFS transporter, partial [Thermoleophilia bacterium]|nr:MFS transporter [Thermoleophilia bacterium]
DRVNSEGRIEMAATNNWVAPVQRPIGYERRWWILGILCLSLFLVMMDNTILNVALPTLVRRLHATNTQLQWVTDAYVLVFAGLLLTAGSLSDRFGRRLALGFGLVVFGAGSLASAYSGSPDVLIATRAVMGLGAAFIMPATLSILTNVFPRQELSRAIGLWAGVSGLGIALGPVLGGLLLDHFWWGSIFLVNLPIVIVAVIAGRLLIPESKDPAAPPIDVAGFVLSIAGLGSLIYAIIQAPSSGWTDPLILTMFAAAAVLLAVFVWWELRIDHPMLNIHIFQNRGFTGAAVSVSLVYFAMLGAIFLLTQYLQFIHGYTPLEAGLRTAPFALVMMVFSPIAGQVQPRLGSRVLVTAGMVVAGTGLYLMSRMTPGTTYPEILGAVGVLGLGMALAMSPATATVMSSVPLENAGVGSAVNDTTREVGGALGIAIMGSVFASAYASGVAVIAARAPAPLGTAVKASVGSALGAAARVGGTAGHQIATTATNSFIDAMSRALIVGMGVAFAGAVVAVVLLPNRAASAGWQGASNEDAAQQGTWNDGAASQGGWSQGAAGQGGWSQSAGSEVLGSQGTNQAEEVGGKEEVDAA